MTADVGWLYGELVVGLDEVDLGEYGAASKCIEVMRMTSLVTFTSAPAILGGKKNCSALSAALTYGTVARPESSSAGADCL